MDVKEVLSYMPDTPGTSRTVAKFAVPSDPSNAQKHKLSKSPAEASSASAVDVTKKRRLDIGSVAGASASTFTGPASDSFSTSSTAGSTNSSSGQRASDPDSGTVGAEEVDESTVRRMLVQLEKRGLSNQEMRAKFPDQPKKFMESELDLQEILQELQIIAAKPNLYPLLVEMRSVGILLGLLIHDNTDISLAVVDLLRELLAPVSVNEAPQQTGLLLDALMDCQMVQLLVQNLGRLDESNRDEAEGVFNTLNVVENLTDVRPEACPAVAKQGLMAWLLKRAQKKAFDRNKLYVSEIMAVLVQSAEANQEMLGELDGIDILLQQLAVYKRNNPGSVEETEMMLNLFDCLCSSLLLNANRDRFLKGEGIQLMNLMLREKQLSRDSAIKVLSYAMCGDGTENEEGAAASCTKFVDVLGLRTIFPLFMHSPPAHPDARTGKYTGPTPAQMEEYVVSVIASLLRHCTGSQKARVVAKFTENDHEKVERLSELHYKYFDKVKQIDAKIQKEKQNHKLWEGMSADEMEAEIAIRRQENGLITLQLLDTIMLEIAVNGSSAIKERVMKLLRMRSTSPKVILRIVEEYVDGIGDDPELENNEKKRLLELMKKFEALL